MTSPGHVLGWHRWADEAAETTLTTPLLINGRPPELWEAELQDRARRAALERETAGLFNGVNHIITEDNGAKSDG